MEAIVAGPERRERLTAEIMQRTGIDEAMIERLVHGFYAKVRADAVLGPIFEARIRDWEPHLAQMCAFWSSVALMTGRYHGTPMVKHLPLPVDANHFDRWLELFEQTAARSARPRRKRILSNGRGGSRPASSSASPAPTASCSATGNDFDAIRQEQSNGPSCTCRDGQGAGRSVFRQQPGADARHRLGADLCRDDRGRAVELRTRAFYGASARSIVACSC